MTDRVVVSAFSHTGAVRRINEDSLLAADPAFLVADGMGGHARGDRASQEAVRVLGAALPSGTPVDPERVIAAIAAANEAVRALSEDGESGAAVAGTTLTGVVRVSAAEGAGVTGEHWMVVNIGDSRVYSWDGRRLSQLSVDHSAVQELIDAGELDAAGAAVHPERNVITRALGASERADADVWLIPRSGDQTFLICSDGLIRELSDDEIAAVLGGDGGGSAGADAATRLVTLAVEAGGRDNVTAIVIESHAGDESAGLDDTRERVEYRVLEDTTPRG